MNMKANLAQIIASSMEPTTITDAVADYAKTRAGKPLTVRDCEKLKQITGQGWHIRKQYGMTHLDNDAYTQAHYSNISSHESIDLLVAHTETGVLWPEDLAAKNPAYYAGAKERNAQREALLHDAKAFAATVKAMESYGKALKALEIAKAGLDKLTAYDAPAAVVEYEIKGLFETKK